jgi:hypothetical protein
MSVPVGPHGSFEVAIRTRQHILPITRPTRSARTISNLDLNTTIPLGDILHPAHDFRHAAAWSESWGSFDARSSEDNDRLVGVFLLVFRVCGVFSLLCRACAYASGGDGIPPPLVVGLIVSAVDDRDPAAGLGVGDGADYCGRWSASMALCIGEDEVRLVDSQVGCCSSWRCFFVHCGAGLSS